MANQKIIRLWGGLGNQLFQYSLGKFLEYELKKKVTYNIEWYSYNQNRKFLLNDILKFENTTQSLKINFWSKILNYRMEKIYKYYFKKGFDYSPRVVIGYWQDIFFANYLKNSNFKLNFFDQNNLNLDKEYYVLHYRGGDFFKSKNHIVLSSKYYKKVKDYFKDKILYCVSDDHENLNKLLNELKLKNAIKLNLSELDTFKLIYNSSGGIASNSTFCWWPIFLSKNTNWVFPNSWLKGKSIVNENLNIENTLIV